MLVNRRYAVLQRLYKFILVFCHMLVMFLAATFSFTAQAKDLHICYESSGFPPFTLGKVDKLPASTPYLRPVGKNSVPKKRKGSMVELVAQAVKNSGFHPLFYRIVL